MRISSALLIVVCVAIIAACGSDSDSTEVESTSDCSELRSISEGIYRSDCTVEADDARVAGTETQIIDLQYDEGTTESGSYTAIFETVNDDGSWAGTATGTFGDGGATSKAEMIGHGAYEGFTYTFDSGFDDEGGGAGTAIRTGTIETADS